MPRPDSDAATPVSDAPTCASCQKPFAEHGAPHGWDNLMRASCPAPALTGTYRPTPKPAALPSAAPLDLDAPLAKRLHELATEFVKQRDAGEQAKRDQRWAESDGHWWRARECQRMLNEAVTPDVILALVAAARRGVADTEWQLTRARSALENWGRHHSFCTFWDEDPHYICSCGLAAAIRDTLPVNEANTVSGANAALPPEAP